MDGAPPVLPQSSVLLLAVLALIIPAATAIVVALIGRGGASRTLEPEPGALTIAERDKLLDQVAKLDEQLGAKDRELARLHAEVDLWQGRAYDHGYSNREAPT